MPLQGFLPRAWEDDDPDSAYTAGAAMDQEERLAGPSHTQVEVAGNLGAAYPLQLNGCKDALVTGTLNADCVVTVSGLTAGALFVLAVTQDATGGRSLTLDDGAGHTLLLAIDGTPAKQTLVECRSSNGVDIIVRDLG
jgi:hypothetical protein